MQKAAFSRSAAGLLVVLLTCFVAAAARAQDCSALVYDEPGLLKGDYNEIEAAASKLASLDAEVHVRIIQSYGDFDNSDHGFLAQQKATEAMCPSWQATDGGPRSNLVVFWLELDHRRFTFYTGGQWRHLADQHIARINDNFMAPKFGDGRFDDGFAAGMNEFARLVELEQNPPAPGTGPTTIVHEAPTDLSGFVWVLGFLIIGGAGIALTVLFVRRAQEKQRQQEALQAAQQRAKAARTSCSKAMADLREPMDLHGPLIGALKGLCSEDDIKPLRDSLEALQKGHGTVREAFGNANNSSNNPDAPNSASGYERIASTFEGLGKDFARVQAGSASLAANIRALKARAEQAAHKVQATEENRTLATAAIAATQQAGFRVQGPERLFQEGEAFLAEARVALSEKSIGMVEERCVQAEEKFASAKAEAESLSKTRDQLTAELQRVRQQLQSVDVDIPRAESVFSDISANYAESSWTTIRGNGTEAENRLERVGRDLTVAEAAIGMDQQDWAKAQEVLQQADVMVREAGSLLHSIFELKKSLEAAKLHAASEIEAAEVDIEAARQYIMTHDDDIAEEREAELDQAKAVLVQAQEELARATPDFLQVVQMARKANMAADQILDRAQSEHQTAERKRQRVVSSLRDAKAAISRAEEYIQDHERDVRDDARRELQAAQKIFARIGEVSSLDGRIENALKAESHADKALQHAQSDVSEAERARARARRRAQEAREASERRAQEAEDDDVSLPWGTRSSGSIFSSSGSSSSSSGSSGRSSGGSFGFGSSSRSGGSSFSFGGSSRGGGRSSSFGSSSRGGGRSSGW